MVDLQSLAATERQVELVGKSGVQPLKSRPMTHMFLVKVWAGLHLMAHLLRFSLQVQIHSQPILEFRSNTVALHIARGHNCRRPPLRCQASLSQLLNLEQQQSQQQAQCQERAQATQTAAVPLQAPRSAATPQLALLHRPQTAP
jgi:hypothetical protein